MSDNHLVSNGVYRHFKGRYYKLVGEAKHTETNEREVVYRKLYDDFALLVRPKDMFLSEVDHDKYPQVRQKYRFELQASARIRDLDMVVNSRDMLLYAITDSADRKSGVLYEKVKEALDAGVTFVQLREKSLSAQEIAEVARPLKELCAGYRVPLVIDDSIEAAILADADGVHLGQDDMEISAARRELGTKKIIGVSAHTLEEALKAEAAGADYIGAGDMFGSTSKDDTIHMTYETLKAICVAVDIPVVAIGGINPSNVLKLVGSGISGVAAVSGIFSKQDVNASAGKMRALVRQIVG